MKGENFMRQNRITTETETKKPRLFVSTMQEYEKNGETLTNWTTIGNAIETEKGITVFLNALPINGRLFIGESKEENRN